MKEFKIRCSALSQIMTEPKTKAAKEAGELSETAKTYCENWLKEQLYNRGHEFTSKYTAKGTFVEADSIEYLNGLRLTNYAKNETQFENDYMTGTPDILDGSKVIDIKNSWDVFSFPLFDPDPDKKYVWQLQGYMILTGATLAELIYILSDAPDFLIESEAKKYAWANNINYMESDLFAQFAAKMTYSDVSPELKIKSYTFEMLPGIEAQIQERVQQCRNYIYQLKQQL